MESPEFCLWGLCMIEHLAVNFEDQRGIIRDIFVGNPKDHCTIITFNEGSVRGNHFHKASTQYTYIVSGEMTMVTAAVDENGNPTGSKTRHALKAGDLATHPPYQAHAFRAEADSIILAFADGVRGGEDYEADVYRLEPPLL